MGRTSFSPLLLQLAILPTRENPIWSFNHTYVQLTNEKEDVAFARGKATSKIPLPPPPVLFADSPRGKGARRRDVPPRPGRKRKTG